jgi:hypothetical protein
MQNRNSAICFVWVRNFVSHIKERAKSESERLRLFENRFLKRICKRRVEEVAQ